MIRRLISYLKSLFSKPAVAAKWEYAAHQCLGAFDGSLTYRATFVQKTGQTLVKEFKFHTPHGYERLVKFFTDESAKLK